MAISVNWGTSVISVPQADLTNLGNSIYELDVDSFRLSLKALEDDPDGMPFPKTHIHNTSTTLSGVTYARTVEILPPYTVEFEDGNYSVSCVNANHNISDRKVVNSVSLIINNSAGGIDSDALTTRITELWKLQGLDSSNPMTVTPSQRTVDDITQNITGDGVTTSTVTRQ